MARPARLLLILIGAALSVLLAACNLGDPGSGRLQPTPTSFGGVSISSRATPVQIPSITPLFSGPPATRVPFTGGSIGSSALQTQTAVAMNPIAASTPAFGAQNVPGSTAPVATNIPGSVTVTIPTGQIASTANNIFSIIFEFLGGTISTLWAQAGQAGGFSGQVLCCLIPGIIAGIYLFNRVLRPFRRRRR